MSINAISSISLYEYYYSIDKDEKKKKSPLASELEKYNIASSGDEKIDAVLLENAKKGEINNKKIEKESLKSDRPWADIMYQLGLSFNEDPADDIQDIKDELRGLLTDIQDKELEEEIKDLEKSVEDTYISYTKNNSTLGSLLTTQLDSFSNINRINVG